MGQKIVFRKLWNFTSDKIQPIVDKVFTFDQAKGASEYLTAGSHFGKVVVKVV